MLKSNRFYPVSDEYPKSASSWTNNSRHANKYDSSSNYPASDKYPKSNSSWKNKSRNENKYDYLTPNTSSNLKTTRGRLYSSGSETATVDEEEKSKTQIQDWDKVNMLDLLDEYDRLHKKKQKGSAEEE